MGLRGGCKARGQEIVLGSGFSVRSCHGVFPAQKLLRPLRGLIIS